MIKTLLSGAAMAVALGSPALAKDDERPVTPVQAQVRERMAVAVLDLCLPVTNGADMAASPALAALGSPEVTTPDYDPETRETVTDDGVHVTRYANGACGAQYMRPETLPPISEEQGVVGDALRGVIARLDAAGSGWAHQGGDWGEWPRVVSADFTHWIEIDLRRDSATVTRYLNPPEVVRAYFEATARAEARSGPQAILDAPDTCALFLAPETVGPELSEAYERTLELDATQIQAAFIGRMSDGSALRGNLDAWLVANEGDCSIQANARPDFPDGDLNTLRSGVLALLGAEGSGWIATGDKAWTRADGARLALGDGDPDTQAWTVIPAS